MKLYDFQKRGVAFHLKTPYSLNACEMGLGKTVQALEAARRSGAENVAVFCPKFLATNWGEEVRKFYPDDLAFNVGIFPYSRLTQYEQADLSNYDTWICDEAHYLKNYKAGRTNHFHSLLGDCGPARLLLLTGTPIKNRVAEFWSLLHFLSMAPTSGSWGVAFRKKYPSQWAFENAFCHREIIFLGRRKITKFYGLRKDRVGELKSLISPVMYRVRAKDALSLPPVTYKTVKLGLRENADLRKEFTAFTARPSGNSPDSAYKRQSALIKAPRTAEYIAGILEEGQGPVLCFTDHVAAAERIAHELKTTAIHGQTRDRDRERLVSRFADGKSPVLITTTGTGSVGYNHTVSRHCVFNDRSWVPADNLQAEKRVHRIGQSKKVVIHDILCGPVDAYINQKLHEKMEVIQATGLQG